jgi:ADP-heptose:LPS heptosyltransferase
MRRERFDCVIDLVKGDSTSILFLIRMIVKGKPRIGLRKLKFKPYYEFSYCDDPFEQEHMARTTLEALRPFGIDPKLAKPYVAPYISDASNRLADSFFSQVSNETNISRPPLLVGLNLSAGHPSRRWPLPDYKELVARLGGEYGQTVRLVLITTPKERYLAEEILSSTSDKTLVIPPNLSISQVAGIVARLDLVVSPDTSIIHIARAFQIPVVGLYTAERMNLKHWHPYGAQEGAVISPDENSLSGLTVEMAFKKLAGQLALLGQEEREHR